VFQVGCFGLGEQLIVFLFLARQPMVDGIADNNPFGE